VRWNVHIYRLQASSAKSNNSQLHPFMEEDQPVRGESSTPAITMPTHNKEFLKEIFPPP
jgi:hypothetical protein